MDEAPSRLPGDQFHFVEEGVESGAAYSFTIVPVSIGYQADITGPGATVFVQTWDEFWDEILCENKYFFEYFWVLTSEGLI